MIRLLSIPLLLLIACAPAAPSQPSANSGGGPVPSASPGANTGETVRLEVAQGTEARYRAREQLAGVSLPNDAVGKTNAVTGALTLRPDGTTIREDSKFTIDLRTLVSDDMRRDRFIQMNTLQTSQFPNAEFVPTEAAPTPFRSGGQQTFQLPGELTVHGVTKPVTLQVVANIGGPEVTGTATTDVKLADFGMQTPRVPLVLSIEETIKLEIDFRLRAAGRG